jgi:hypothetical protein
VLSEREAKVLNVRGFDAHGVPYVDLTIVYRDGTVTSARVGGESVPQDLQEGEDVLVSAALSVIVAVRRPGEVPPS